jgi:hypothetical protein
VDAAVRRLSHLIEGHRHAHRLLPAEQAASDQPAASAHSQSQLAINQKRRVVEMKAMNRIGVVDEKTLTVDVEPGVVCAIWCTT